MENKHIMLLYFFQDFMHLLLERREGREIERVRNIEELEKHLWVASCAPPTRDLAPNPGMCPDQEFNQRPFGFQDDIQPTEPHQPGLSCFYTA